MANGEGFPTFDVCERLLMPLKTLAGPLRRGQPLNVRCTVILDVLMFALAAEGIVLHKTEGGIAEEAAAIVLRNFGDDVKDPWEAAAAIFNYRNAMIHSFGFHHLDSAGNVVEMQMFQASHRCPVVECGEDGVWGVEHR